MNWPTTKLGDTRTVVRFAWLPVELDDGTTVWLEQYVSEERFERYLSTFPSDFGPHMESGWRPTFRRTVFR